MTELWNAVLGQGSQVTGLLSSVSRETVQKALLTERLGLAALPSVLRGEPPVILQDPKLVPPSLKSSLTQTASGNGPGPLHYIILIP